MTARLLLKLAPVAIVATIALFLAVKAPPQADASVSGLTPSTFVVNSGNPVSFAFAAQAGAGSIVVSSTSSVVTFVSASCGGCAVSGNGTSAVSIVPPPGTSAFTVNFTLDVACTASGVPVSVAASQGNTATANGVTGTCFNSCVNVITPACCAVVTTACSCAVISTAGCVCTPNVVSPYCAVGAALVTVAVPQTAACGSQITILATLRSANGVLVQVNTPVVFSSNMGTLVPVSTTTYGGTATTSLILPVGIAGTATVTAASSGVAGQASISVSCAPAAQPVAQPVAPPLVAAAPVPVQQPAVVQTQVILPPNTGDGGCLASGC